MTIKIPDGFTAWRGGINPVPGRRVMLAMRPMAVGAPASQMKLAYLSDDVKGWLHNGNAGDIVAYKVLN